MLFFFLYLGTMVKVDGDAATAATVPSPKASLSAPSVAADVTSRSRGLSPISLTLPAVNAKGMRGFGGDDDKLIRSEG